MPNYIPYIIMAAISISTLTAVLIRTKQYLTIVLFLCFSGMTYLFEYIILILLNSYEYFPEIIPIHYLDNLLGAIVSNFIVVPTIATVIAVFQMRVRWILFFSLLFGSIEWIFVHLGLFQLHWWKTPYTIGSLLFYFWFTRRWITRCKQMPNFHQFSTLVLYTICLTSTLIYFFNLFGVRLYQPGFFDNVYRDDASFSALTAFVKSIFIVISVYWSSKLRFIFIGLIAVIMLEIVLIKLHILLLFIPYWQYFILYIPCCLITFWLTVVALHALRKTDKRTWE